jgi:protoheme IX farnesyltransferase
MGFGGFAYAAVSVVTGTMMVVYAWRVYRTREGEAARKACVRLFTFSILYLFLLFIVLLAEHLAGLSQTGVGPALAHLVGAGGA